MNRGLLASTIEHLRDYGGRETWLAAISKIMTVSAGPVLRRRVPASLYHLHAASRAVHLTAEAAGRDALKGRSISFEDILSEYDEVRSRLREAYCRASLTYPADRRLGAGSSLLIYALVRGLEPDLVLETGIANGHSTFVILSALGRNNQGRLVSVDVDASTGGLLQGTDTSRWDKRVLDSTHRRRSFERLVSSIEPVHLFLHDSDHTYRWQRVEYETVYPRMAEASLMTSDDVDSSFAFIDFCQKIGRRPTLLVEARKVFGMMETGTSVPETPAESSRRKPRNDCGHDPRCRSGSAAIARGGWRGPLSVPDA